MRTDGRAYRYDAAETQTAVLQVDSEASKGLAISILYIQELSPI
jgi:hypothetical protein